MYLLSLVTQNKVSFIIMSVTIVRFGYIFLNYWIFQIKEEKNLKSNHALVNINPR